MTNLPRPAVRPARPYFSAGPTCKRPGWSLEALADCPFGRSHRSKAGKSKIAEVITLSREVLGIPKDYRIGIVPASDTGAVEMAMWSLLGERGVDVCAWEHFGGVWVTDTLEQLKITDARTFTAPYGQLPDLSKVDTDRDVVFTWNGTAAGTKIPHADWIKDDRKGLTICDATSAVFATDMPWEKLDVVTWSWQKVMGGEAQHGMLVLSPRAVKRLETYNPPWPIPKLFQMTKKGKLIEGIFEGDTINTVSMLAVEDHLDALKWLQSIGGLPAMIARSDASLAIMTRWVEKSDWAAFLSPDPATRSNTALTLMIKSPVFTRLSPEDQAAAAKMIPAILEKEGVAFDCGAYRDAPPGLRVWAGGTVEPSDVEKLLPWLDWAYAQVEAAYEPKARCA